MIAYMCWMMLELFTPQIYWLHLVLGVCVGSVLSDRFCETTGEELNSVCVREREATPPALSLSCQCVCVSRPGWTCCCLSLSRSPWWYRPAVVSDLWPLCACSHSADDNNHSDNQSIDHSIDQQQVGVTAQCLCEEPTADSLDFQQ